MITTIISYALFMVAGAANGLMGSSKFHWKKSFVKRIFVDKFGWSEDFWNPKRSWVRKYREIGNSWIANILEKLDNSWLSFTTDGWRLLKEIMITSICLGVAPVWWMYLVLRLMLWAGYKITYR